MPPASGATWEMRTLGGQIAQPRVTIHPLEEAVKKQGMGRDEFALVYGLEEGVKSHDKD